MAVNYDEEFLDLEIYFKVDQVPREPPLWGWGGSSKNPHHHPHIGDFSTGTTPLPYLFIYLFSKKDILIRQKCIGFAWLIFYFYYYFFCTSSK